MRPSRAGLLLGLLTVSVLLALAAARLLSDESEPPPRLEAEGVTLQRKVDSVLDQARRAYPHLLVTVRGLGNDGLLLEVGWERPDIASGRYEEEVRQRAEDQREATISIFQAVARAHQPMAHFGAFEDRMLVPIWSRAQILSVAPRDMRDFSAYSSFQLAAEIKEGYAVISGSLEPALDLFGDQSL